MGGDVKFSPIEPLSPTPQKGYSARGSAVVNYKGIQQGLLNIVAFCRGDGTGDESKIKESNVQFPDRLSNLTDRKRIIPRAKLEIVLEAFFPLYSVQNKVVLPHLASLEELTLDLFGPKPYISKLCDLGVSPQRFVTENPEHWNEPGKIQLTTGYSRNGQRFGDPHAVFYGWKSEVIQVVGFLAIKDANNPLCRILDRVAQVPDFEK